MDNEDFDGHWPSGTDIRKYQANVLIVVTSTCINKCEDEAEPFMNFDNPTYFCRQLVINLK